MSDSLPSVLQYLTPRILRPGLGEIVHTQILPRMKLALVKTLDPLSYRSLFMDTIVQTTTSCLINHWIRCWYSFIINKPGEANIFGGNRLPDVIKKHSARKPTMIFCSTRQMCQSTAKMLAEHFSKGGHLWPAPGKKFSFRDRDLQSKSRKSQTI